MSQIDVWRAGGPSNSVMTGLESGSARSVSSKTLSKLDTALQWEPGSARRVYEEGGEPVELAGPGSPQRFLSERTLEDAKRLSARIADALAPATEAQREALNVVMASLPKIDFSSFIPKDSLKALGEVALPASVVANFQRVAERSASELLPGLIELLTVEQRACLTYAILDVLEEQGVDVDALLDRSEAIGGADAADDELAARRDSNSQGHPVPAAVDDDDPTAGLDPAPYAAHPRTEPLEEDSPTP